jgi:hypothetical protein
MWWIGGPVLAFLVLFLAQGFLLQVSVALTGEPAPRYGRATKTWILASLLGTLIGISFSFTLGWLIPTAIGTAIAGLLMVSVATLVFKRQFGISLVQAGAIALIYNALAMGFSALTWYLLGLT